jgi:hypothetical protein
MFERAKPPRRTTAAASAALLLAAITPSNARADESAESSAVEASAAAPSTALAPAPAEPASPSARLATPTEPRAREGSSTPWILVVSGGVALSVGIALGTWSVVEHRAARDLRGPGGGGGTLDDDDQATYDEAIAMRDDLRVGSGIAAAAALGLFVTGGVLFALDELDAEEPGAPPSARATEIVPLLAPGFAGGVATFRFW